MSRAQASVDEKDVRLSYGLARGSNCALASFLKLGCWAKRPAPNTYRGSIAIRHGEAALMTTAKQSKLLGDLENHRFPCAVPIKQRAQRQSVVQLDAGIGKGAEHLPRQARSGYILGSRTAIQSIEGAPGNCPMTQAVVDCHMELPLLRVFERGCSKLRLQLDLRLGDPLPALRTEELVHVKVFLSLEHIIDRTPQFVGQDR